MKTKYLPLLFLAACILSSQLCFSQLNPKISPVVNQFGARLITDLEKDNIHGSMSVAILKNDRVIWSRAFGYVNSKTDTPADTTNIYRIGSITKTFTATLLMQLAEEGKVKLDDLVENYVPEIKNLVGYADYGKITFRQLASHTSGLNREPGLRDADVGPLDEWENKVLASIPQSSFNSKAGEQFLYSNIGYAILGLALERVSGVPYLQMVKERIFTPLHMNDSFFALPEDKRSLLVEGLANNDKGQVNTKLPLREIAGRGYRVPNGGIFTTPNDLAKFVAAMEGKTNLLTAKSLRQMQSIPAGGKNYGLGLMIINNRQFNVIGHNGSVPGYTSQFLIDQDSGYAVIIMRNYNFGSTDLERAALGLLKELKQAE
jgi:CubicO group peptidase (beta-lactamase class C family)